jgi:hypothetical protein
MRQMKRLRLIAARLGRSAPVTVSRQCPICREYCLGDPHATACTSHTLAPPPAKGEREILISRCYGHA